MRLLFSITYYTPYISGLTLYVKRLGEALAKRGHQVNVLTMRFDKTLTNQEFVKDICVIRADYFMKVSKGFISFDWLIKSWQEVQKADVVLVNLPQFEGIVPAILGKLFGKRVISIYHCEVVLPPGLYNKIVEIFLSLSNIVTLILSHKIVTYTKDFADHSLILGRFPQKLFYIYPPINNPIINKRVQKIIKKKIGKELGSGLKGAKGLTLIGIAARLAAEKGIEYLLEAIPIISSKFKVQSSKLQKIRSGKDTSGVKSLRHLEGGPERSEWNSFKVEETRFKIVIAGPLNPIGEEKYKENILELVEKYKDSVVFLGKLEDKEMGSFYSLLDVLVLPSVNSTEAFGMVQVEAMIAGVPVVASDLPGVRVPIQKTGMGLLVPIKNSQKLAEAIIEVILNKKKYIKDKKQIEKEFSIKKTIEFYQKLIRE